MITPNIDIMRLLGKEMLEDFKIKHSDARSQIDSWRSEVEDAKWNDPHDIKNKYKKASILKKCQVIFDICGNKYRILTKINYKNLIVLIKKVGTHDEYDKWEIEQ